jgi:FAD/FMN-containing dehydrogenase
MRTYLPGDTGYDEHRRPLRTDLDSRPELVVEAFSAQDVRSAVATARRRELPLAVQATGHGTHRVSDGGLLLKTSAMRSVLVDPDRRIARVGPGARWGQVLAAAAPFGLAPLSGSSQDVGVTGYTLGGGMGWLARKHGFAADSVLRAQIVTADGRLLTVSRDQYPDLFWAIRGGGGNFGIVTSLEFALHPVATVFAGSAVFSAANAAQTLARYRDWALAAPDELSTAIVLRRNPDGASELVIKALYAGDGSAARRLLRPLWAMAGVPLSDNLTAMPYASAAMGGTGARYFDFFPHLSDDTITAVLDAHATTGSTAEIRHWAGAIARPSADAGPAGHRDQPFSIILDNPPAGLPLTGSGTSFLNFLADPARTATAFTPANLRRLRAVKRAYDPANLFSLNLNIVPTAGTGSRTLLAA